MLNRLGRRSQAAIDKKARRLLVQNMNLWVSFEGVRSPSEETARLAALILAAFDERADRHGPPRTFGTPDISRHVYRRLQPEMRQWLDGKAQLLSGRRINRNDLPDLSCACRLAPDADRETGA
ncbi:MAG: hypothetical protein JOZ73_12080 [Solirubrobacterales bacterium]|nr:hypothetical protein [Solirubrobacterales bacterium]